MIGVRPIVPDGAVAGRAAEAQAPSEAKPGAPNEATMIGVGPIVPGGEKVGARIEGWRAERSQSRRAGRRRATFPEGTGIRAGSTDRFFEARSEWLERS